MPVKPWEFPPNQQNHERQLSAAAADEPRSSDTPIRAADANEDAGTFGDDLSAYGDEPINIHGSER